MKFDKQEKDSGNKKNIAVAVGYDACSMDAPQVLATGRGYLAEKIVEAARENNITIESNPVLAEALGQLDPGQEIPPELYQVVAEILVFIMETDGKIGKTGISKNGS